MSTTVQTFGTKEARGAPLVGDCTGRIRVVGLRRHHWVCRGGGAEGGGGVRPGLKARNAH